jgi:hypothetical protein
MLRVWPAGDIPPAGSVGTRAIPAHDRQRPRLTIKLLSAWVKMVFRRPKLVL